MYKLLAIDMDGTLLSSRRTVSRANAMALRKAVAAGVHVTICTGRGHESARIFTRFMGVRGYVVSANGAIGHDPAGKVLFSDPMDPAVVTTLIRILRRHRLIFHIFTADGLVAETRPWPRTRAWPTAWSDLLWPQAYLSREASRLFGGPRIVNDVEEYLRDHGPCLKFFCVEDEPGSKEAAMAAIRLADLPLETAASGSDNVEFTAPGVHKASGLARLAAHLGVHQSEVAAVGDHLNDLEMLRWAGLGVAVANAVPEAKEAAREVIALSNDEHAVAAVVHSLILT